MVHWFAAVTCHNWERNQYPVTQIVDTITVLYGTNLGDHNSVTKPSASLHETCLFSAAATKGWAWSNHNAELVERAVALRNLKLLVSGRLDFTKGMDSIDKHVEQISFRQCLTVSEHGQLKGWTPDFEPTVAKNSISTIVHCFGGSCCMETWGGFLQDSTTNRRGDHKPKNLIETCLWEAWLCVAWIEEGQQILGTENLRRKIIRIHHLFTT